jgi:hypothetical protein
LGKIDKLKNAQLRWIKYSDLCHDEETSIEEDGSVSEQALFKLNDRGEQGKIWPVTQAIVSKWTSSQRRSQLLVDFTLIWAG